MYEAIAKLNSTIVQSQLIYLYFNTYLIKSVFFVCGIVELLEEQNIILQKIYKATIAKKMKLRTTFLRAILYMRQNVIGMRLITLKINIAILICKLYIGNIRAKSRMNKLIQYHEELIMIENSTRECK